MPQVSASLASESDVVIPDPLVTAVIPTRDRPGLVMRAVRSALRQSYHRLEVVVVIDGPDEATSSMLESVRDERLRVISLAQSVGGAEARNVGIQAARGEWIALLDDDDEWLPEKVTLQLQRASHSSFEFPVVSSRIIARTPQADYIWPRRLPHSMEPVAEYLFCRKSFFQGEGMIQTSTIFTKRALLQMVPFTSGLKKHQDWDWVIRGCKTPGARLEICSEALTIYHIDEARPTISHEDDWLHSLTWIRDRRKDVTRRAYAAFVLLVVAAQASKTSTAAYMRLFSEALRSGSPSFLEISLFAAMRLIPRDTRHRLRAAFGGSQR